MFLKTAEVKSLEKRKKIDIFYEIQTHTVTSEVKNCPSCGARNKGQFPKGMSGPLQYGVGIRASIINFIIVQMLSFQRVGELIFPQKTVHFFGGSSNITWGL